MSSTTSVHDGNGFVSKKDRCEIKYVTVLVNCDVQHQEKPLMPIFSNSCQFTEIFSNYMLAEYFQIILPP
jgi:hypothetical protein